MKKGTRIRKNKRKQKKNKPESLCTQLLRSRMINEINGTLNGINAEKEKAKHKQEEGRDRCT